MILADEKYGLIGLFCNSLTRAFNTTPSILLILLQIIQSYQVTMNSSMSKREQYIRDLLSGTKLNEKYNIGCQIAGGRFGVVFFASDFQDNPYAIKVVDLTILETITNLEKRKKLEERLNQEDEAMRACSCPYVVKFIQCLMDYERKLKFIVMEYCNLGSLQEMIEDRGHIPEIQARKILQQVVVGLASFHQKGRLHRDIKSENICGMKNRFVLADFGSASIFTSQLQERDWRSSVRIRHTNVGSPLTAAPQMLLEESYGTRADLYGIGILFYEMLTGVYPFMISSSSSPSAICSYMETNINLIYDPDYIRENLKKVQKEDSGCSVLSIAAVNFLKKLIVFNQAHRIGWKSLLEEPYLVNSPEIRGLQLSECIFPLQSINWKQVKVKMATKLKKTDLNGEEDYECSTMGYQVAINEISKQYLILSDNDFDHLRKIFLSIRDQRIKLIDSVKLNHFEVRRLELLKQVYGELGSMQHGNNDKVMTMISCFCEIKAMETEKRIQKNSETFIENYKLGSLVQLFQALRFSDEQHFKNQYSGLQYKLKAWVLYSNQKFQIYEFLKGNLTDKPDECLNLIKRHIKSECDKMLVVIGQKNISHNLQTFLSFPNQILWKKYKGGDNSWQRWDSLDKYREYKQE